MGDEGHRVWTIATRPNYHESFVEVLFPRAFLAAAFAADEPAAPEPLAEQLECVGGTPALGGAVRAQWPVDMLQALTNYAEECVSTWTSPTLRTANAAAQALAEQARRRAEQEA